MKTGRSRLQILLLAGLLLAGAVMGLSRLRNSSTSPSALSAAPGSGLGYDLEGHPVDPLASMDGPAVVLLFLGIDCPISNGYAPVIRRLRDEYSTGGVKIWLVYPGADTSIQDIMKHQTEFRLPPGVLRDPTHSLVALSHASVTPEAAVFLPGGRLVYHGRIDNRHENPGSSRPEATEHDLQVVLQRIVDGEAVTPHHSRAVGCYIPRTP